MSYDYLECYDYPELLMIATIFLDLNIGLLRRIKLKFMFQEYSPLDLSRITLGSF